MLLQKWGGCTGLPSRYRCFQHGCAEMEASGLPIEDTKSFRKNLTSTQSFSAAELEKSGTDRTQSPKVLFPAKLVVKGTPASPDLSSSRSPVRGYSREFLCPGHPPRAKSMSSQRGTCSNGMGLTNGTECDGQHPNSSAIRRRHSLSRLPTCDTRVYSPVRPLAGRAWGGSALDLRASLPEERQAKSELGEASCGPRGHSEEPGERNLELELNMMQFELFSLKQKQMESSFAYLEKEKKWLETNRSEQRKQKGDLDDKIFSFEMELAKAKSYLGKRTHGSPSLDSGKNVVAEKKDIGQELITLQESLVAHKKRIKALEGNQDEMAQQLKSAKEGQQTAFSQISEANQRAADSLQANQVLSEERCRLQAAYNSTILEKNRLEEKLNELNLKLGPALADRERLLQEKVALHQQVQHITLKLECAQKKQEGFSDQVSALHSELVSAKAQFSHQDKEKVLMKEELGSVRQANKELSSEVAESRQRLETSLEELHHLEAEKKILENRIQALEDERTQLLGEKEGRPPQRQVDGQNQEEEEMKALQESCENLRESQTLLQREKDLLQSHCLELEAALHGKQEEMDNQLAEQQQVSQYWRDRWGQVTAALKTKEEEEEEKAHPRSPTLSAKVEAPLLLQIQLDACKQELELERNRSQALHHQIQLLQSGSQRNAIPTNETSMKEADTELALVREELQKVWDVLRTRDAELESSRSQYIECSSEKQRLEELVTSLEEQLAEKEQALRELKQTKNMDRPELESNISSLEPKGRHRGSNGKVIGSPQREQESLKWQHHLVTEQLKGLFKQRQQQQEEEARCRAHPGGFKEESSVALQKSPRMPAAVESIRLPGGGQPESLEVSSGHGEAQSLWQQLKEKTETISSMSSEIKALKQKNESLMKAKLRFQQQIQEIRRLSKQRPERSSTETLVPRLSVGPGQDWQSAPGRDSLVPSPQSDEPAFSLHGGEAPRMVLQGLPLHPSTEDKQSHVSSAPGTVNLSSARSAALPLRLYLDLSDIGGATSPHDPRSSVKGGGALLSPRGSGLLSPRPFGPQRLWSPFNFKESPEPPEN